MGVYEHIVVGVDGSDASAQAAEMAGRRAGWPPPWMPR